jgi:hypothetical protein
MPIVNNKLNSYVVIRATSNETYALADVQMTNETVNGLEIKEVFFSGNCAIARGANTLLTLNGTDHWRLDTAYLAMTEWPAANVVVTVTSGSLIIVLDKLTTPSSNAAVWANTGYYDNP